MSIIMTIVASFALIVGSLTCAVLIAAGLWLALRRIGHPGWAALPILALVVIALFGWLPNSEFVKLTVAFAVVLAIPIWLEGRGWQARHPEHGARLDHR